MNKTINKIGFYTDTRIIRKALKQQNRLQQDYYCQKNTLWKVWATYLGISAIFKTDFYYK